MSQQNESGASESSAQSHGELLKPFGGNQKRGDTSPVPTVEDCLRALSRLPGLTAIRVISPAMCNSIKGVYVAIMGEHHHAVQGGAAPLPDDVVLKFARDNPQVLELIEPLLTQEQVDLLMRNVKDDGQHET